ncbi:response regulator [Bittarella massiliensis]|uniref:hybrid sensor histidine kinase/response regulator n=1 Tax=Bittarella massiliensis (ex Durand et al. 2017) TaxID=1720313 RepID=UPI00163C3458|nr:response regulator [Bittarella massiliensis (ex Durand et al. 2017)]MBC2872245.1 response regulator [Bittarella massiliensis (ex Durand et al. 2017)]
MKKENRTVFRREQLAKGRRINAVCTVCLVAMMLLYLLMTIVSSAQLAAQTDIISEHPFEVVISAGDVKLYLSEMQVRTERLLRYHGAAEVDAVRQELDGLYTTLQQPLSRIEELYLGGEEDTRRLKGTLEKVRVEQEAFLEYAARDDTEEGEIAAYSAEHLTPLYRQATDEAERLIAVAQEKKVGYGETATRLRRTTLVGSVLLISAIVGVFLFSQRLLRRQRDELAYRGRLFDDLSRSIDDAFVIRDARTGAVQYSSLNLERVLGLSFEGGDAPHHGLTDQDVGEIRQAVRAADQKPPQGDILFEKMLDYRKPDGEHRWLLLRLYRVEGADAPQIISVLSDRTEEVRSRQALRDAMLTAERASSAKSDFLSRMSHEIRTPLNAIIGMTTIAAASAGDASRVEDCLQKINFSSKHLLMLINDVLDMSKIESDKMTLQEEPFDIFQLVNGFVSTIYAQAKGRGLEFGETMEGFGDQAIYLGDPLRLNQILLNLGSNAVKFTEPGGSVRLKVSRVAAKSGADVVRFAVTDTGIGMSKEAVERIFQPFEQADATIAGRFGGTGLGMSITKNLVSLMGGKIRIDSEPGKGTTCEVDIPLRRGKERLEEPDFGDRGLCAMVVDDEQQVCEQTSTLLEKIRIRTEWRQSGAEAVERIGEAHRSGCDFDLCLVDWKMPGMDGIEVTRRIRREVGDELPIVMISAYDISEVEWEAREAGVNGFLPKPLYRSSVYTAIREAVSGRSGPVRRKPASAEKRPLAGLRLLVAEDNSLNREIAEELLRMNGAEVVGVENGEEAVEAFLASDPGAFDAILMDVQMPVMNGHEAAQRIRLSQHPAAGKIPIIATTANAFGDDISAALAAGMNAHVSKPLDIDQLCRVLLECVQKNR